MIENIHYASISTVSQLIKSKTLSPVELTEFMLNRIETVDGTLKSFATLCADSAMQAAEAAEKEIMAGNYRGLLHGIPLAVKDLCYTQGIRTMGGLKVRREFVPSYDATVVTKLQEAGAILLGKLNLTEGALSAYNSDFDIPVNPWGSKLWSGVSSSGSGVATAAGLCFGSLGTDTGGSIRYPSMANGIVGLKPSYGLISRHGVMELARSLDHVGPMTRSVLDAAILFDAIAGYDARDETSLKRDDLRVSEHLDSGIDGLRIGIDEQYYKAGTNSGLIIALENAIDTFREMGVELVPVSMPNSDPMELRDLWLPICGYEAALAHRETYPERKEDYGGYLSDVLEIGHAMNAEQYERSISKRKEYNYRFETELKKVDAVVCPAGGHVMEVEKEAQYGDSQAMKEVIKHFQGQFTIPADLAGTPSLTLPCGFSEDHRPYALQLLGPKFSEANLCRLGHAFEQCNVWHLRHPQI